MTVRCRTLFPVVASLLGVWAASAIAATPAGGEWTGVGEGGGYFTVKGSTIKAAGAAPNHHIFAPSNNRCNSGNLVVKATAIKISGGAFSYDGPAYVDYLQARKYIGRLVWSGKFTTSKTVKGKYRFRSPVTPVHGQPGTYKHATCDSGTHAWSGVQGLGTSGGTS